MTRPPTASETCPYCGGDGRLAPDDHVAGVSEALWRAIRCLEDRAIVVDGVATERTRRGGQGEPHRREAQQCRDDADVLRRLVPRIT